MDTRQAQKIAESYLQKLELDRRSLLSAKNVGSRLCNKKYEEFWHLRFSDPEGSLRMELREDLLLSLIRIGPNDRELVKHEPFLPEAMARKRIGELVQKLGWSAEYPDISDLSARHDEERPGWGADLPRVAQGVRFSSQGAWLRISGQGQVLRIERPNYTPAPKSFVERISAAQAVAIADACIRRCSLQLSPTSLQEVTKNKRVVQPSAFWDEANWKGDKTRHISTDPSEEFSRVAWIVVYPVPYDESRLFYGAKHSIYSVYVDIETGAVIGGWHGPHLSP
ncbi:hypothetical protein [Armatimonas rosea]|uniref:Uncharacterized protein n=1 Tax=Armatimonas rosea TaxID=685828 RepID=A0A7W9SNA8_ARMRO|nr:hypothetical protein [Armatimonas rosea]MBB6049133.1 hypothetical protein [Armatimonas rosea]